MKRLLGVAVLEDIGALIGHSHDLQETLENIVKIVAERMGTEVCSLYLFDPKEEHLTLWATTGLDRGSREDDATHLSVGEGSHGERHREIGLAGSRRADREGHRVPPHRVDVPLLVDGLGRDLLAAVAPDHVLEDVPEILGLVERGDHRIHGAGADLMTALDEFGQLVHDCPRLRDVRVFALERQAVAAQQDRDPEAIAENYWTLYQQPRSAWTHELDVRPDGIAEYERLHANTWPEVLAMIQACNIRNYSIYRHGELLFAYFEYVGEDFASDMSAMAANPVIQEWWARTDAMQEPFPERTPGDWWLTIPEIFHAD